MQIEMIFLKSAFVCMIAVAGFFVPFNFSLAATVPPPCFYYKIDPCFICKGSGDDGYCSKQTFGAKPFCVEGKIGNEDKYFYCSPTIDIQVTPSPITFGSSTSSTLAGLICSITKFISDTILPPIAVLMALVVGFMFLVSGGAPQKTAAAQKALLFTVAGVFLLLLAPGIVKFIGDLFGNPPLQQTSSCGDITTGSIVKSFIGLINWFSWFVAITSVVMGLYSGFLYLTARDDPARAQKAAKVLSYVIIGVAVSVLAFSIITIVRQFAGLG